MTSIFLVSSLIACRALRALGIGLLSVALPLWLHGVVGLTTNQLSWVVSAGMFGATVLVVVGPLVAKNNNRLISLATYSALFAAATAVASLRFQWYVYLAAAFLGAMSLQPNVSPHAPLEHAALADGVDDENRTATFARYNATATLSMALGSCVVAALHNPRIAIVVASLASSLATLVYVAVNSFSQRRNGREMKNDLTLRNCTYKRRILRLGCLFAVDAFAGGAVVNALMAHWLSLRFESSQFSLGLLFFLLSVVSAASFPLAATISKRIGLLNTMVFTHIPSNLCLVGVAYSPDQSFAFGFLIVRALTGQMDVPARESFMTGVVPADERVACSTTVVLFRAVASAAGPAFAGYVWTRFGPRAPLLFAGTVKTLYDLSMLVAFGRVKPPEEQSLLGRTLETSRILNK